MTPSRLLLTGTLLMLGVLLVIVVGATQIQRHEGYFSPVFSPDGRHVYFLTRETRGVVTGLGWETLTPPAHVFVWSDQMSLRRVDTAGGEVEVLTSLGSTPLVGRRLRTYRGRAFVAPATLLRWTDDGLEVRVRLGVPVQPTAELHFLAGRWNPDDRALDAPVTWSGDHASLMGGDESPLSEAVEVLALPGLEAFPCAVVRLEAETRSVDILVENGDCPEVYPAGVRYEDVSGRSRRADIERVATLESTQARLTRAARASGVPEHEIPIRVIDQMRDLGDYPHPPRLVAQRLDPPEVERRQSRGDLSPLFVIEEMQFTVGLFQDLERALDTPGTPVDKSSGRYVIHDDYTTSESLNTFFAGDGRLFFVQRGGDVFRVELVP